MEINPLVLWLLVIKYIHVLLFWFIHFTLKLRGAAKSVLYFMH